MYNRIKRVLRVRTGLQNYMTEIYYGRYITADIFQQTYYSRYITANILQQVYYGR